MQTGAAGPARMARRQVAGGASIRIGLAPACRTLPAIRRTDHDDDQR